MTPVMLRLDRCRAFLLDILFPNRCPFCGGFIRWDSFICENCREKLASANDFICRLCGSVSCVCNKENTVLWYDAVFGSFFFDDENVNVGSAIHRFKHTGEENIAAAAAEELSRRLKTEGMAKQDIVVPVPMGKKKQKRLGHNQAELFARCIGRYLEIPVKNDILYKYDTRDEQHSHSARERSERVKGLFYTKNTDLSGMRVIICDDVMTTGSTVNECARLLKAIGAESVIAAVCAVTRLDSQKNIPEEDA